mmetsp:Transcript_16412/g.39270  ORF Transcript_16412/g.39270 Transcript_16412/m.39270 type:complete len:331 (+) Transcript_16412:68-1060(+)
MPQPSTSTSLAAGALPSSPRWRRKPRAVSTLAVSTAAALVLLSCPSSVHAEGGLRGGSPRLPQHQLHEDPEPKLLMSIDDEEEGAEEHSAQEERTLAKGEEEVVSIDAFTVDLLATKFPSQMSYNTDNQISSAVATYLAPKLDDKLESYVVNIGLDCSKDSQGGRWVLSCDGKAMFDGDESDRDVNDAVAQAFAGENLKYFLEIMYSRYEMMHEMEEYDTRFAASHGARRRGGGGRGKNKGKKQGGRGKKKDKNKGKNKGGKGKNGNGKKQKNKDKKPQKMNQQMMKPQSASSGGKNNLNIMGYESGTQQMQAYSSKNIDKDGNIIVYIP